MTLMKKKQLWFFQVSHAFPAWGHFFKFGFFVRSVGRRYGATKNIFSKVENFNISSRPVTAVHRIYDFDENGTSLVFLSARSKSGMVPLF
jgi:hypothetical protein